MLILFHSLTVVVVFSLLFSRLMALKRMGIVDNYEVCVVKTPWTLISALHLTTQFTPQSQ